MDSQQKLLRYMHISVVVVLVVVLIQLGYQFVGLLFYESFS